MRNILILTGDAGESLEILYPKFRLEEEGWKVTIAAPAKKKFLSVVHDFEENFDTYTEKPGYRVQADLGVEDVNPGEYHGLVLPGGRAPEYLRNNTKVIKIVSYFLENKLPVAANCHGPLLIFAAGGGAGCEITAYPDLEPDVRQAKANFQNREVVVDKNLISVRGWPDNSAWMREFVRVMKEGTRQE